MQRFYNYDPFSGRFDAINNLGGMEHLYHKYVERFQDHHQSTNLKLSHYIESQNYEDAYILVHSVRGLASTLGMQVLCQQAEILENALKEGRYQDLPPLVYSFQAALYQTVHAPYLQSSSSVGT